MLNSRWLGAAFSKSIVWQWNGSAAATADWFKTTTFALLVSSPAYEGVAAQQAMAEWMTAGEQEAGCCRDGSPGSRQVESTDGVAGATTPWQVVGAEYCTSFPRGGRSTAVGLGCFRGDRRGGWRSRGPGSPHTRRGQSAADSPGWRPRLTRPWLVAWLGRIGGGSVGHAWFGRHVSCQRGVE